MKIPVFILSLVGGAFLTSQGWIMLAIVDLGKEQAAQRADIVTIKERLSESVTTSQNDYNHE